jgi:hypothetical protein
MKKKGLDMKIETLRDDTIYLMPLPVGLATEGEAGECLERGLKGDWLAIVPGIGFKILTEQAVRQGLTAEIILEGLPQCE